MISMDYNCHNMFVRRCSLIASFLLAVCFLGCAGKSAPSGAGLPKSGDAPAGLNELISIRVEDRNGKPVVILEGTAPMSPNIFKLGDPDRIIVDLTDTKLGSVETQMDVNQGGINQITANQFDDANSSLSRVVIGLNEPLEYQVESQANSLVLNIGGEPLAEDALAEDFGLPDAPEIAEVEEVATEDSPIEDPFGDSQPLAIDVAPETTPEATAENLQLEETPFEEVPEEFEDIAAPVTESGVSGEATELVDVQYSSSDTGTIIKLIGNLPIGQYEDFVLQDPQRVVLDLKGLKNAYPGDTTIPLGTSEISNLRIGASDNQVRIVLDVANESTPAYTLTREGNALVLNVAKIARSDDVAEAQGAPIIEDLPDDLSAGEALPEPPVVAVPIEEEPLEPLEARDSRPIVITGLGFKQMKGQNKSRLIINLSDSMIDFSTRDEGGNRFVISIQNSRLERDILKRHFDTREFQTAILSVEPTTNRSDQTTEFVVELEQPVPYTVTQVGNNLIVDVDIPEQILRDQTPTLGESGSEALAPPSEGASMGGSAEKDELILDADSVSSTKAVQTPSKKKNYRYVKEEFMSESIAGGEPLSRMGAILSGLIGGRQFTGRKISLDFKDADVRSIFRLLADISKFNMIISDDVEGRVTIRLDDVPWDQAFAIILQTRGLWFERYGNIVRIAPAEKLLREKELAASAARAAQAAKPLDVLFKPVSFAKAETLIKQVGSVLSERGTVDIDSRTNTLIIKDIRENLEKARRMVDILDTQTPQVSIEARIVEATTTFTRSFGITWSGNAFFSAATGNPTGLFFPNAIAVSPFALNFPVEAGFVNSTAAISLGSINNVLDLDLALALGEQEGYSKLISAPKVTVLDNSSATITAGTNIPFITQTANAGSNVRFQSAATSLSVTPHITNDGSILMNITATRNQPNFAQTVQGNPLIDSRSATTEVLVKSGNTTVLGGIYSTEKGKSQSRFPFLSRIPIIGALFRNYDKQLRRTELLIFVTPRIVGDEREAVRDVRQ